MRTTGRILGKTAAIFVFVYRTRNDILHTEMKGSDKLQIYCQQIKLTSILQKRGTASYVFNSPEPLTSEH